MIDPEIPLLRCSATYSKRLIQSARIFDDSGYYFYRRVNWSYRYSMLFYENEADCFRYNPKAYIADQVESAPKLEDVYALKLKLKQVLIVCLKVIIHWAFYCIGRIFDINIKKHKFKIYRKAYVDDIEMVYDSDQPSVIRGVYPFPLSIGRQWRYFRFLRKNGYKFKPDGNPYGPRDLLNVLFKRDIKSLMYMESRAQIRHAQEIMALGVEVVQLSDEFDVGSLDFTRALRRFPVRVINSAHGVGTYLPVHAYHEFYILTNRQKLYYKSIHSCEYRFRPLNKKLVTEASFASEASFNAINLVFLSQTSSSVTQVVATNEVKAVRRLANEFANSSCINLLYRAHPNSNSISPPTGFKNLGPLERLNGKIGTIYLSFFSTCYIDPNFVGKKILLRGNLIYPELIFDDLEDIYDLDELVKLLRMISIDKKEASSFFRSLP